MAYIFFLFLSLISSTSAMNPIVILKDDHTNVAAITDAKTLQELNGLSAALAARPLEEVIEENQIRHTVLTGLPKELIIFLLQLDANIEPEKLFVGFETQAISLANITRSDIPRLGLAQKLQDLFDDLVIIETTRDNQYTALKKSIITSFFETLANLTEDFKNQFIIPVGVIKKEDLADLYTLLYPFLNSKPLSERTKPLSFPDQVKIINFIKQFAQSKTPAQLISLLESANFMGARPFILKALYEVYKTHFPKQENLEKQLEEHLFLQDIAYEVEQENKTYSSIEELLKQGKTDFYLIKEVQHPTTNEKYLIMQISGHNIYYLKGLNLIPKIRDCRAIIIKDTKIATLKEKDLDNLNNLQSLHFWNNPNLNTLEKNSLRKFNLEALEFKDNKINTLSPDVFILPNLEILKFDINQIKTIKTNWAKSLNNLTQLTLEEPELTTLEPGWLNGLQKLKTLEISPSVNATIAAQIKYDIKTTKINLIMPGNL